MGGVRQGGVSRNDGDQPEGSRISKQGGAQGMLSAFMAKESAGDGNGRPPHVVKG